MPQPKPRRQSAQEPLRTGGATGAGSAVVAAASTTPGPLSSFVRFVVCGGGVGLLSGAAVPLVATLIPWALANAVITVVSTLVCTELHAFFTFGTGRRAGWRRHLQSAGSATAAYGVTTAAVFVLYAVRSSPDLVAQQSVYLGASALAGTGRFVVLRLFVFADRARSGTAEAAQGGAATPAAAARATAAPVSVRPTAAAASAAGPVVVEPPAFRTAVVTRPALAAAC
ncbi:GtrA family protein [Streptomyces sp. NPDC088766]|uniref:GtrA family protein n=1 Tax=Streptomyces sp. NPDC088766 TaxID=3365893 RepID=UPI003810D355